MSHEDPTRRYRFEAIFGAAEDFLDAVAESLVFADRAFSRPSLGRYG
jgi:hypothetical protein